MKKLISLFTLSLLLFTPFNFSYSQSKYQNKAAKKPKEVWPHCVSRMTVAIDQFKTEDISLDAWNDDIALNSREVAVDELVNSKCFSVLEREHRSMAPAGIMNEKALARSKEAKKSKVAKKRGLKVAPNLVTYAITGVMKGEESIGLGLLTAIAGAALGAATDTNLGLEGAFSSDKLYLTCRITDTETTEIKASASVKVKANNVAIGVGGIGGGSSSVGGGALEFFKNSKVGKMMQNAVNQCSIKLAKSLVKNGELREEVLVTEAVSQK